MEWYLQVLKQYAVFNGRARRKEYWMFALFNIIVLMVLGFVASVLGSNLLTNIYLLGTMIPATAVAVRRMHDTDHSGWWLLLPIVNFVFGVTEGTRGDNRFGPDPKATAPRAA